MKDLYADVKAFHDACDIFSPDILVQPPRDRQDLRHNLISEEVIRELFPAMARSDLPEIADAMADSLYVIVGTALEYGVKLPAYPLPSLHNPHPLSERAFIAHEHLIAKEVQEKLLPAIRQCDIENLHDFIDSSIFAILSAAQDYEIPLDRVWDAVQAANMAKVDADTGKVIRRADGKILKPEGWTPPDIAAILFPVKAAE